jgi:hypothetical protein
VAVMVVTLLRCPEPPLLLLLLTQPKSALRLLTRQPVRKSVAVEMLLRRRQHWKEALVLVVLMLHWQADHLCASSLAVVGWQGLVVRF